MAKLIIGGGSQKGFYATGKVVIKIDFINYMVVRASVSDRPSHSTTGKNVCVISRITCNTQNRISANVPLFIKGSGLSVLITLAETATLKIIIAVLPTINTKASIEGRYILFR